VLFRSHPESFPARAALIEAADDALRRRRFEAAGWAGESLTMVAPQDSAGWSRLVTAQRKLGQERVLGQTLRRWVEHCPDDEEAVFLLRAHQGEWADAAPPDSVRRLFDRYAPEFDEHLAQLGYRAPQQVAARLTAATGGRTGLRIADLGCGTGLVGPLIRPTAAVLVGVDLSPGMLGRARRRDSYDELVEGELVAFLQHAPAAFDALVSADTMNYLGDLRPALVAARSALAAGGVFVFTLETGDRIGAHGFRLADTGRFEHDSGHVVALLAETGWQARVEPCILRREGNRDVSGLLVTAVAI
jgi:predicted TPR repeat methyltransferase